VIPIRAETIVAWRAWRLGTYVTSDGTTEPFLRSCVYAEYWPAGERFEASCPHHPLPAPTCGCGVHGVTTREEAVRWALWAGGALPNPIVLGRVNLWGKVLQFSRGYRAQYAYPYELEVPGDGNWAGLDVREIAERLRRDYLVDVVEHPPLLRRAA
jgi:hypothetical protein